MIWIYRLADFLGGIAAAYLFLYVLPAEKVAGDIDVEQTEQQSRSNASPPSARSIS